jgi:hypothetical protein
MERASAESLIKMLIIEIRDRLTKAASIAAAAHACASEGNAGLAIEIMLDVEQLSYEAGNLLNAASTINRISGG